MAWKKPDGLVSTEAGRKVRDYGIRRMTALQFVRDRVVEGLNNTEVAKKHGVSRNTVERTLTWAEKAGIFLELEDKVLHDIAPIALNAIQQALSEGRDVPKGALEILQGLNILKKNHPVTAKDVKESDDLAAYINQQRLKAQLEQNTIEGTLADVRQLPPGSDLIPGYSPELLAGDGGNSGEPNLGCERSELGGGDAADAAVEHPSDPERVPDGDGTGPDEEAAPPASPNGDQDCLSSDEGPGTDPAPRGRGVKSRPAGKN
jgi:transposase-like protein